jgi:hypothetical protein
MTFFIYRDFVAHQPAIPPPVGGITSFAPRAAFVVSLYYAMPAFVITFFVVLLALPDSSDSPKRRP